MLRWQVIVAVKVGVAVAAFGGMMYAAAANMSPLTATAPSQHIVVSTPVNWSQVVIDAMPAVIALVLALTAYVKSRTNQQTAIMANEHAVVTAAKVDSVTSQVNGSLSQTQERVARLEGLLAQPIQARDPISPVIPPLPVVT